MKTRIVMLLLLGTMLSSCHEYGPDYTYTWVVSVIYTNGDTDTITCSRDSFNGNLCMVYLKTQSNGIITTGMPEPCLTMGCGFYSTPIACGVRQYHVLTETRESLPRSD